MNNRVTVRINKLKDDRLHGAGWLSRQAISTLILAISHSQAQTVADLVSEIRTLAGELVKTRPSITPIANYVNQFVNQITAAAQNENDLGSLKSFARVKGNEFIRHSTRAVSKAVEYGCGIVNDLDTVVTCSYSSTVCKVFELAKRKETNFHVIVAQSIVGDEVYGEITAKKLSKDGISVEIVPDAHIHLRISKASKALVGADSITADGYLINGTPTLKLAQAAKRREMPFFTVCETAKFDIQGHTAKLPVLEPGFDKTPLDLITGIITEKGTMAPSMVITYIEEIARNSV